MDEKGPAHAGESLLTLLRAVLKVIVFQVPNFLKIWSDLVLVLPLFGAGRPVAPEVNVVPHAVLIIDWDVGVNSITFGVTVDPPVGIKP